jgi:hypothetical protein
MFQEEALWLVMCELTMEKGDTPSGNTIGFMNIVTWAPDSEVAIQKITTYLGTFNWQVVSVERSNLVDDNVIYGEDIEDQIERARGNKMAIILGTFHSYETN